MDTIPSDEEQLVQTEERKTVTEDVAVIPDLATDAIDGDLILDDEEILFKSTNVSPMKDVAILSPTRQRLDTVRETRRTLERSFAYGRGS